MKDIPYSLLKKDGRAYEVMLLRDQYGHTFTDIAKKFNRTATWVSQIYYQQKIKQIRLYINHISVALGYDGVSPIRKVYEEASDWYQDYSYACAYFQQNTKIF